MKTQRLFICLTCGYIGCGKESLDIKDNKLNKNHLNDHFKEESSHSIFMEIASGRTWYLLN